MRKAWNAFVELEPVKRASIAVYLISGVVGGAAVSQALADPDHAETWFVVAGGIWIAMTAIVTLLGWLSSRRRRQSDRRGEAK